MTVQISLKTFRMPEKRQMTFGGQGLQGRPKTGGGGFATVPNLRVCIHFGVMGVAHAGGE